jgi:hypothetical protein
MRETINPVTWCQVPEELNLLLSSLYKHTLVHQQCDTMLQWQQVTFLQTSVKRNLWIFKQLPLTPATSLSFASQFNFSRTIM